jgi:hypothetical protein
MRFAGLALFVACAGKEPPRAPLTSRPPIDAAPAPMVGAGLMIDAAIIPPDASDPTCWSGTGPIAAGADPSAAIPVPTSTTPYPFHYPLVAAAESARRAALLAQAYPGFEFVVDDVGVVTQITTTHIPCELRAGITMANQEVVAHYLAALAGELTAVPFLTEYGVTPSSPLADVPRLAIRQTRDVAPVLTHALPATELDDAAILRTYKGARVEWWRIIKTDHVQPSPNPCLHYHGPHPCDPPGPRVTTVVTRKLLGARTLGPRYIDSITRTTEVRRDAKALQVRRVATLVLDDLHLAADLFGSESAVDTQYDSEVVADGWRRRDAITGAVLPAPSR